MLLISAAPSCDAQFDLISDAPYAIPDSALTASSVASPWRTATNSRLNSLFYWRPAVDAAGEWIQVNMLVL